MASLYDSVDGLIKRGKRKSASTVQAECARSPRNEDRKVLNQLLDILLDPRKSISDQENVDWLKWLVAGGYAPDEFAVLGTYRLFVFDCTILTNYCFLFAVKEYDNATTCGLVWTANFVAYRCRTCGISPCMSLCAECFQKGNHEGHDFNVSICFRLRL